MADRRQIISTSYTAFTSSVSIKIKRCTIRSYKTTTKPVSCRSFVDLNALPVEYQSLGNSSGCLHHTLIDVGDDTFLHYIKYCIVLMIFISVLFLIRALTKFIVSCWRSRVFIFEASVGLRDRCKLFVYLSTSHGFTTPLLSGF